MPVHVVPHSDQWAGEFARVAKDLHQSLDTVPVVAIEHVGSTAVPKLAAKPIIDIDIVVLRPQVAAAISALEARGYTHLGDLGVTDREALAAPNEQPKRNVYVCVEGTLHLRNHLAVRRILRLRPDLRDRYGKVKLELAHTPDMDIATYLREKSAVLQEILRSSGEFSTDEQATILDLNAP